MTAEAAGPNDPTRFRNLPPRGWPRLWVLLARALMRRCPLCGTRGVFRNWFTLRDACPHCRYRFDREDGYFLGAYALNLIVAELITVAVAVALSGKPRKLQFTDSAMPRSICAVSASPSWVASPSRKTQLRPCIK